MRDLKKYIRDVPDFPKKGIIFKDITTLLKRGEIFKEVIDTFAERYKASNLDSIVSVEARGFIMGSALAYKLGTGLIPVRKKGKLPYKTDGITYNLEYGTDTLEIHKDAIKPKDRVLIIDDLLATGGTLSAVAQLVEKQGGEIAEIAFLIELAFLNGRDKLKKYDVFSLIKY